MRLTLLSILVGAVAATECGGDKCRWFAISVALWLTGLACARTTMPNIDASEGGTSGATGGTTSAGGTTTAGLRRARRRTGMY